MPYKNLGLTLTNWKIESYLSQKNRYFSETYQHAIYWLFAPKLDQNWDRTEHIAVRFLDKVSTKLIYETQKGLHSPDKIPRVLIKGGEPAIQGFAALEFRIPE